MGKILPQAATLRARRFRPSNVADQLNTTIRLIGQGIKEASTDPAIRFHAAQLATRAPWKDYHGQLRELYDDFLTRWTYVKDPLGQEALQLGRAAWLLTMGAGTPGKGYGDCDDATIAIAGMARAIGLAPRIVIMAPPGRPRTPTHVYPEVLIPGRGWIPVDPVARPKVPFGRAAPAAWRRRFDLDGREINCPRKGVIAMRGFRGLAEADIEAWPDHDLALYGLAGTPDDGIALSNWNDEIVSGFGAYIETAGYIENPGFLAEVDPITADGLAITPILELSLDDYNYVQQYGEPYEGMTAIGDDGSVYQYQIGPDGIGFFKKLFRAGRKLVRKVVKGAKKIIKKLPGGKYLVKLHDKAMKFAKKLVKPLAKFVGPLARKLAPIAALVPGYGTAIAAALHTTGTLSKLLEKHGVKADKKTGRPMFRSPQEARAFKSELKAEAACLKAKRACRQARRAARRAQKPGHIPKGTPQHSRKLAAMGAKAPSRTAA
jgi:hypothetical protein